GRRRGCGLGARRTRRNSCRRSGVGCATGSPLHVCTSRRCAPPRSHLESSRNDCRLRGPQPRLRLHIRDPRVTDGNRSTVRECAMPLFSKPMNAVERLSKALGEIETSYANLITLKKTTVGGRDVWPAYRMAVSIDVLQQVGIRRVVELAEALGRDVS